MQVAVNAWKVPVWTDADLDVLVGRQPADYAECHDPLGARLYLGLRTRATLLKRICRQVPPLGFRGRLASAARVRYKLLPFLGWRALGTGRAAYLRLNERLRALARHGGRMSDRETLEFARVEDSVLEATSWGPRLVQFETALADLDATLLVQGSQADRQTTEYSDVDLMLVGRASSAALRRLRGDIEDAILAADPLQHHGVFMVDSSDLEVYWQSTLPIASLALARNVGTRSTELSLCVVDEPYGQAAALLSVITTWEGLLTRSQHTQLGLWEWKFRLSQLFLIPVLLLAAGSFFVYKGLSFEITSSLYSEQAWTCMSMASEVRNRWPDCTKLTDYASKMERRFGVVYSDPTPTPQELALLDDHDFRDAARLFLEETRRLAGL